MSVSVSICYHLAATSPVSTFLNNFLYYTPLHSCTYYGQGARDVATLFPALPVVLDRVFSRSKWTVFLLYQEIKPLPLYAPGLHAIWAWFALCACAKPLAKILATPLRAYKKYYVLLLMSHPHNWKYTITASTLYSSCTMFSYDSSFWYFLTLLDNFIISPYRNFTSHKLRKA